MPHTERAWLGHTTALVLGWYSRCALPERRELGGAGLQPLVCLSFTTVTSQHGVPSFVFAFLPCKVRSYTSENMDIRPMHCTVPFMRITHQVQTQQTTAHKFKQHYTKHRTYHNSPITATSLRFSFAFAFTRLSLSLCWFTCSVAGNGRALEANDKPYRIASTRRTAAASSRDRYSSPTLMGT